MGTWQPILTGTAAERARETVVDIARSIAATDSDQLRTTDRVLFWAYIAGAIDEPWVTEQYDDATTALATAASSPFEDLSLYYGAAGIGFTIAHVSEPGTAEATLEAIDALIAEALSLSDMGDYDLISGLAGVGVYLVERGDVPTANAALEHVIRRLAERSEKSGDGLAWFTAPERLPPHERVRFPAGSLNCGLAHGMPAVIALCGRVADRVPAARQLALDGMRWLRALRGPASPYGRYPAWIARDLAPQHPTRTAWCYGDPGIAVATYTAQKHLGLPTTEALELAREAGARAVETSGVLDAGLCHGTAGIAHICNRLFQDSGDEVLRGHARTWFERTLDMRGTQGPGVGGYMMWQSAPNADSRWMPATIILDGAMGVALSLLAAIESSEPNWDRLLMCAP